MKSLIFDLDGTLIDSMKVWTDADNIFLKRYGFIPDEEYTKTISYLTFTQGVDYILRRYRINKTPKEVSDELYELAYHQYANHINFKPGAIDFLEKLKKRNIRMAIATSCIPDMCYAVLKRNNAMEYFDTITFSDEVGKNKTFPDIYIKTAGKIGAHPKDCFAFEDVPHAVLGAKKAGMTVVGVFDEFSAGSKDIMMESYHYYINSFDEFNIELL